MHGIAISQYEVTNVTRWGFWLWVDGREYFVPFTDYPCFEHATIAQLHAVERLGPGQFHWPDLDADIELDALAHPERFPLQALRPTG
jgi:hypothetical protein